MRKRTEESKLHLVNDEQMKDFTLEIDTDLEDVSFRGHLSSSVEHHKTDTTFN